MTVPGPIRWDRDDDGVVTLTFDDPSRPANSMNTAWGAPLRAAADRLVAERDGLRGVILASAKDTFFDDDDLEPFRAAGPGQAQEIFNRAQDLKARLRTLETLGVPVVAAVNGTALGGGFELALAAHHRIVVDAGGAVLGLPAAGVGLLPGAGGLVRCVRMFGVIAATQTLLFGGPRFTPGQALDLGLVDELVEEADTLPDAARAWIDANPRARQPWDAPGHAIPGGTPSGGELASRLPTLPAILRRTHGGAPDPAPRAILAAAVEGAQVDFQTACDIESRYFTELATGQVSTNMITSSLQRRAVRAAGPGPFTARIADAVRDEALAMLAEGVAPASVAQAAGQAGFQAGFVVGLPAGLPPSPPAPVAAPAPPGHARGRVPVEDLTERLLFAGSLAAIRAVDDAMVRTVPEANVGSLQGAGFPPWTGGVLQYVNGYGPARFVARARELSHRHGPRFEPPASLAALAGRGEEYL
ncbi:enoyl-CoA hydratase/isomerase family protein [Specibacter cremeus]|uniref:enoyl-CoA hydratase/isomerase family protein n=1 Tax=Specibacter cremeus TaxID=1629051 RepID=UPI000F7A3A74|nr:enoyl-CoA hydratase/isomerase family protein [Specibacter cremeus]